LENGLTALEVLVDLKAAFVSLGMTGGFLIEVEVSKI